MGSKKSSSSSASTTQQTDNRIVAGEGATALGQNAHYSAWADESITDASQRSYADSSQSYSDTSNRSVTTINATDPGAVQLGEFNAQLLGAVSEQQTDAVRALAGFGTDSLRTMGESITDLYGRAGSNTTQAWSATLNASEKLLGRVLDASDRTTDASRAVASAAIATYQPAENKAQDTALKLGVIVAAGVAMVFFMKKA